MMKNSPTYESGVPLCVAVFRLIRGRWRVMLNAPTFPANPARKQINAGELARRGGA